MNLKFIQKIKFSKSILLLFIVSFVFLLLHFVAVYLNLFQFQWFVNFQGSLKFLDGITSSLWLVFAAVIIFIAVRKIDIWIEACVHVEKRGRSSIKRKVMMHSAEISLIVIIFLVYLFTTYVEEQIKYFSINFLSLVIPFFALRCVENTCILSVFSEISAITFIFAILILIWENQ